MNKILILFAHPKFEISRANKALVEAIPTHENITFWDLYEKYPDFNIDIKCEKELLLEHNVILWHHPFYWYSAPALLKQWIDLVLEFGWAYGPGGTALSGKSVANVITTGGARESYTPEKSNRYTIREYLRPFEQTARLCKMDYLPPFAVQSTHRLSHEELLIKTHEYALLLTYLVENKQVDKQAEFMNDWVATLMNNKI